jgi:hypothetical protein
MIINFRAYEISEGACKLIRILTIKKQLTIIKKSR